MAMGQILNFNQQAKDQQLFLLDRMRSVCPQTAALGENLTIKPAMTGDIGTNDMVNARNTQGLTAVLGQACAAEAGNGGFPNFPQFLLQ